MVQFGIGGGHRRLEDRREEGFRIEVMTWSSLATIDAPSPQGQRRRSGCGSVRGNFTPAAMQFPPLSRDVAQRIDDDGMILPLRQAGYGDDADDAGALDA